MIRTSDAITLAYTKLRTRRIRTFVTIFIASLLFGIIALSTLFLQGGLDSVNKFSSGSLSGRYLASASYSSRLYPGSEELPKSVKTRALEIHAQMVADKQAAAKELGITYDPSTEQKPVIKFGDIEQLDASSPATAKAFNEYLKTTSNAEKKLADIISPFHPKHTFKITNSTSSEGTKPIDTLKGETFAENVAYPQGGQTPDINFGWVYMDQSVTQPFMLSEQQLNHQKNSEAIPIIAPIPKVEEALGLEKLANNASPASRLERIQYIRNHAEQATFTLCYRNSISQARIQAAIDTAKDIALHKTTKDYQKPSLIYDLPSDPKACAPASVSSDTRTDLEKEIARKQDVFAARFGQEVEPIEQKVVFRVVGLSPGGLDANSFSGIGSLLTAVAGSTLDGRWVVPQQLFDALPNKKEYARFMPSTAKQDPARIDYSVASTIVEFNSAADVKQFVTKTGCGAMFCQNEIATMYFGTNSVLLDDIRNEAVRVLAYVALAVSAVAGLIMMGMIGRVISDSRRETAVFRAIGARRNDIRLIYFVYTLMLCVIIAIVSLVIGIIAAVWINTKLAPDANVQAHLMYIFSPDTLSFGFIGIWWQALAALLGLILLAGITGMLLPLSRNLARSPIKDMRDDT